MKTVVHVRVSAQTPLLVYCGVVPARHWIYGSSVESWNTAEDEDDIELCPTCVANYRQRDEPKHRTRTEPDIEGLNAEILGTPGEPV